MRVSLFFLKKLPCTVFWNAICTAVCFSLKMLECYMHGSLFFSENTSVCYTLECYMYGSLFFSENSVVCYILECYMRDSSIQFVVFKPLSYYFEETIGFDKQASFPRPQMSLLIKPGDITKKFQLKAIQFHWTFYGFKITN